MEFRGATRMVKKSETAIYEPPKKGFPYLAVTLVKDDVTAVPVPLPAAGTNGVSVGLCTLQTLVPTVSSASATRASDPGAPFGQSGMARGKSFGNWANAGETAQRTAIPTTVARMASP